MSHRRTGQPSVHGLLCCLVGAVLVLAAATAQARVPEDRGEITLSFAPLVQRVAPAVVNVFARQAETQRRSPLFEDPFFQRFFGPGFNFGPQRQNSLGSGVILRPNGLIVTNHHVIRNGQQITVGLQDGSEYAAEVVTSDESTDLALLRIQPPDGTSLPVVELADSDDVEVGDLVLAIGNPFGVGQTVTSGIVSALARTATGITDYNFFIQTDAAINPGNSGGALIGMDGRLIGINTAIYSRTGGSLGIGFAIPSNMVRAVVASVERGTPMARPWLGASGETVTPQIAHQRSLPRPAGVLVNQIDPGSPAEHAGVRLEDVILSLNGRPVDNADALRYRVATLAVEGEAALGLWREGAQIEVRFPVMLPPETPPRDAQTLDGRTPFSGIRIANLSPALIAETGYTGPVRQGVVVLSVRRGSPASRVGFRAGDVIAEVNGDTVENVSELRRLIDHTRSPWRLNVQRGDRTIDTTLRD